MISAFLVTLGLVLVGSASPGRDDDKLQGVDGGLTRIEKNAENAGTVDKVKVKVGDVIEIDWTYPIVPASLPTKVSASSDSDAVKKIDIRRIVRPKILGTGTLGAFFKAEKAGKATLTFSISAGEQGVILKTEVEVVE